MELLIKTHLSVDSDDDQDTCYLCYEFGKTDDNSNCVIIRSLRRHNQVGTRVWEAGTPLLFNTGPIVYFIYSTISRRIILSAFEFETKE